MTSNPMTIIPELRLLWSRLRKLLPGRSAPPVSLRLVFARFQKVLARAMNLSPLKCSRHA